MLPILLVVYGYIVEVHEYHVAIVPSGTQIAWFWYIAALEIISMLGAKTSVRFSLADSEICIEL